MVEERIASHVRIGEYTYDAFDRHIAKEVDSDGAGAAIAEVERFVYDGDHIALTCYLFTNGLNTGTSSG